MKRFRVTAAQWFAAVLLLASIPYALIVLAGTVWLYQRGLLWPFMAVSAMLTLAAWGVFGLLRRSNREAALLSVRPAETWTKTGQQAWDAVDVLARKAQGQNLSLDRPEPLWQVFYEVLETVARRFHPDDPQAVLQIPVPHALRVVELALADFRTVFAEHVPGGHILTLADWQRLHRLAAVWRPMYFFYRLFSFGVNPVSALLREMRDAAGGRLINASTDQVKQWAVGYCVRKAGYYAIQLYSGHLLLENIDFGGFRSPPSLDDAQTDRDRAGQLIDEPLRILVAGQVKAGKSSLINALFGQVRAAVDVVPRSGQAEPYLLEREGAARAIVVETAGYEASLSPADPFLALREEILDCDLVLLTLSARSAARAADRRLLDSIGEFYQQQPQRRMPPVIVVLAGVDQLRPLGQWNPPYDLAQPGDEKGRNIRDAVAAVAGDLALAADQPVVPVCLKPEQLYNVAEALAPAILQAVPEAQRVKYLRCLRQFHREEYWQRLWQQALNSGRLLVKAAAAWK
jgi:hypothetical protein